MDENNKNLNKKEAILESLSESELLDSKKVEMIRNMEMPEEERKAILERVKGKIETAKQKKAELEALRGQVEVGESENTEKDSHEEEQL